MEISDPYNYDGGGTEQSPIEIEEWHDADPLSILCAITLNEREKITLLADHPDVTGTVFLNYLEQVIDRTWLWFLNDGQYGSEDPEWLVEHWGKCPASDNPSESFLPDKDLNPVLTITVRGRRRISQLSRDESLSYDRFASLLPEILEREVTNEHAPQAHMKWSF